MNPENASAPIDIAALATELQVTEQQIRDAIDEVGPVPSEIELHLKGTRASTNSDRVAGEEHKG
ncbi:MAG: DUF3606 domain-containing protein [Caldimonas sp.]